MPISRKLPSLILLICLFISLSNSAQNEVSGKLIDEGREPIAFANVILLDAKDSTTVYKGIISEEDGSFLLKDVENDDYILKTTFIGYGEFNNRIHVTEDIDLGEITLKEANDELDEVTLRMRKPKITRSIDRITFDVENSVFSSGNSWQVLQQTPGVIMNQGNLQVRNGPVTVYINDRKVHLTDDQLQNLLQSFSAQNLKSVEVITNPPARYDAEGGAVININTTKTLTPGYKGSFEGNYTQGIVPKYQIGTSHYWKGEKLNVFANYNFSPRKEIKRDESWINYNALHVWNTDFERVTRSQAHNASVILDYDFDQKNSLNFSSNLMLSPNKTFDNTVRTDNLSTHNIPTNTLLTDSEVTTDDRNLAMDLTYTHSFDNAGQLSGNVHYTKYNQDRTQGVETDYLNFENELFQTISFETDAAQDIDILTGQIDFSSPLGSTAFETGAKMSHITSVSGINFLNAESLEDLYDDLSNNFRYTENVYAGYASISKDWENWSAKGGLRGEYTNLEGRSIFNEEINTQNYFQLFPTAYLQYRASENHNFTFDYSRRIDRPRYSDLNPFRYFLNENDFNAGNPNLRAAVSSNFNLNYTLQGRYFFDFYYRDYGNSPATLAFQNNDEQFIRRVSMNLLENKTWGFDITHGRSITGWWYAQAYASLFHEENKFLALESEEETATNEVDGVFGQLYNSFTLSNDGTFSGNLTFLYVSNYMSGSYQFDPFSTLSIGFRKTLWNKRAELNLNVNDIFNQTNTRLTSNYLNQDNWFFAREETRYVQLGFKYNFGNFRLKDNQRQINAEERDRL